MVLLLLAVLISPVVFFLWTPRFLPSFTTAIFLVMAAAAAYEWWVEREHRLDQMHCALVSAACLLTLGDGISKIFKFIWA